MLPTKFLQHAHDDEDRPLHIPVTLRTTRPPNSISHKHDDENRTITNHD
jgi:hypothetical protein